MKTEQHAKLVLELLELVEFFCDDHRVSGQDAWLVIKNLSEVRLRQLKPNQL